MQLPQGECILALFQVHIRSPLILNGVCVRFKGYVDMERLGGVACLEFDEESAKVEDVILREQVEAYNRRMKEFEEYRKAQQRHIAAFMGQHHALQQAAAAAAATQHQQMGGTTPPGGPTLPLIEPTSTSATSTTTTPSKVPSSQNGQIHAELVEIEEVSSLVVACSSHNHCGRCFESGLWSRHK